MASEQLSRESQQLARATAERQGVLLVADQYIGLGGHCGTDSSLVAYVMVLNLGLVAGRVEGMVLAIDAEQNLQQKIRYPNGKSGAGVAFDTTKIVVKPQDSALVTLRFSCPALAAQGFNLDHAKEEITASIEKKVLKWRIVPFWGYNSAAAQAKPRPGPGDTTRTVGP